MTATLTYEFEDAPLFTSGAFEAGYVTGSAEVSYEDNGDWNVRSISIEVESGRDSRKVFLDTKTDAVFVAAIINSRKDDIDDAVEEALRLDGVAIPDFNAEHRLTRSQLLGRAA